MKTDPYNLMVVLSYIPLYIPPSIYKLLNTNVTCALKEEERNQELAIKNGSYQAILYSPFTVLWDFKDEGKEKYQLPGLFPSLEYSKLGKVSRFE